MSDEQHLCTAHYRGRSVAVAQRTSVEVLAKLLRAAARMLVEQQRHGKKGKVIITGAETWERAAETT